ncbi:hypothetical protein FACS189447_05560 [Spirochaetia bacterium]|nr:hypothetical protein FACS189447_05560 [Spirochaetia bacterium]
MDIIWDEDKNNLLKKERKICFEEAAEIIMGKQEIDFIENPVRDGQAYYIIKLNNYIHVVPAIINEQNQIVLKTIFPSRKFQKKYGGKENEQKSN